MIQRNRLSAMFLLDVVSLRFSLIYHLNVRHRPLHRATNSKISVNFELARIIDLSLRLEQSSAQYLYRIDMPVLCFIGDFPINTIYDLIAVELRRSRIHLIFCLLQYRTSHPSTEASDDLPRTQNLSRLSMRIKSKSLPRVSL